MTKSQKENIAVRLARAITNVYARTGEMPSEEDLKEAILYTLEVEGATVSDDNGEFYNHK